MVIGGVGLPLMPYLAQAEAYPSHPVRILVGFGPGGAPDVLARLTGQWLSDHLGQPVIIENKPGASSDLATEAVVRAPADGYTLLLVSLANAVNATLDAKLTYNFMRDITPIAGISRDADVMVVNPSFPAQSIAEFISYAKANPDKINMASPGIGTSPHMAGELFSFMTGIKTAHVPYHSSPDAMGDLIAGRVQVYFAPISGSVDYIKAGRLRALGVTTAKRADALPDTPTIGQVVQGYEMSAWYGLGAPKNVSPEIVEALSRSINTALADPALKTRFANIGSSPFVISPAEFGKYIAAETDKWAKVIKLANIKSE
jgi:tripartite-type tricarboxylate transporter receptor subunit TctC